MALRAQSSRAFGALVAAQLAEMVVPPHSTTSKLYIKHTKIREQRAHTMKQQFYNYKP